MPVWCLNRGLMHCCFRVSPASPSRYAPDVAVDLGPELCRGSSGRRHAPDEQPSCYARNGGYLLIPTSRQQLCAFAPVYSRTYGDSSRRTHFPLPACCHKTSAGCGVPSKSRRPIVASPRSVSRPDTSSDCRNWHHTVLSEQSQGTATGSGSKSSFDHQITNGIFTTSASRSTRAIHHA